MIRMTKTALACTLALGLIACGGDDDASGNSSANKSNNNTNTSMATNTGMATSTGMATNTGMTNSSTSGMTTSTATTAMTMTTAVEPCESDTPPARCGEDPKTKTDWSPASVISELVVLTDTSCCQDFNGDGVNDNALGSGELSGQIPAVNKSIAEQIAMGSIAIVLEHEGLTDTNTTFDINFLQANPETAGAAPNPAGGTPYKVVQSSFAKGAYARAKIGGAKLEGGKVSGGPGRVAITISLLGITLNLPLVQAKVDADVDEANTDLATKGVSLTNGQLSGVVGLQDLFDEVNRLSKDQCGCFTKDGTAYSGDLFLLEEEGGEFTGSCTAGVSADDCNENDSVEGLCKDLAGLGCTAGAAVLPGLADVRLDDLGASCISAGGIVTCDAISLSATFKAAGAKITGAVE